MCTDLAFLTSSARPFIHSHSTVCSLQSLHVQINLWRLISANPIYTLMNAEVYTANFKHSDATNMNREAFDVSYLLMFGLWGWPSRVNSNLEFHGTVFLLYFSYATKKNRKAFDIFSLLVFGLWGRRLQVNLNLKFCGTVFLLYFSKTDKKYHKPKCPFPSE